MLLREATLIMVENVSWKRILIINLNCYRIIIFGPSFCKTSNFPKLSIGVKTFKYMATVLCLGLHYKTFLLPQFISSHGKRKYLSPLFMSTLV